MFRKVLSLAVFAAIFLPSSVLAQVGSLTGTITDRATEEELPGATVFIQALDRGAATGVNGQYTLANIPTGEYTIRVTYVGYETIRQSVTVVEGENVLDFQLRQDFMGLDEVIVTGQQIERQSRELAYSVSTISAEEITRARETNFVSSLSGKIPGVEVTGQSGNVGGSTRIVIRGISSFSGDNQPLFIVDGVPISNSNIVGGTSQDRLTGAIDVGNRGADINPDDIENVTVLKGAAAAALYGSRAKDGVILISTKQGTGRDGHSVTVNSSVRVSSPLVLPDVQNEYAQGSAGKYTNTDLNGWGPRITGQTVDNLFGDEVSLQAYENNVRDFYENGILAVNSFSFATTDDRSDFRLGITRQDEGGIVPNSNQKRTAVSINTGSRLTDQLTARVSGNYTMTDSKGRAVAGGNDPNVLTSIINTLPRTVDIEDVKNYKDELGEQRNLTSFINNPYWIANENVFTSQVERVYGNSTLVYSPLDWLMFTGRAGIDFYTENRRNINVRGTLGRMDGLFAMDVIQERQMNFDFLSEINRDLTEDFSFRGIVGYNLNIIERDIQRNEASNLEVDELYNFANANSNSPNNSMLERRLFGVYADATFGYRNYVFLNVTGRNDWSSTLPQESNSFFYPSVNLSFVFTEAFNIATDVLSYGKLRANWANVGSDEDPYQLAFTYSPISSVFGQYGTGVNFPFGGRTGFGATGTIPPSDLRPQNQVSMEVGGELQFYDGRVGVDFTYYDVRTEDQIVSIPIPQTTGYSFNRTNVGEISNKGFEAQLTLSPVQTRDLGWFINFNFTKNQNRVESLAEGLDEIVIQSGFNSLQVKAEPGKSLGLYGPGFQRDEESGLPIIDANTGLRQEGDIIRLGDIDPDFRLSMNNTFSVRGVNLSFLIDWRQGGHIFSQTVGLLRRSGMASETAENRNGTFIDEGVIVEADGSTRPNDVPVENMQTFWNRYAAAGIHEGNIFSATNVRLREVRLDYTLPLRWMEATPISSLSIGFEARNLLILYKEVPHIDPEVGLFGSAANGQGIEWNVLPSTRSFGTNIQLRF